MKERLLVRTVPVNGTELFHARTGLENHSLWMLNRSGHEIAEQALQKAETVAKICSSGA